VTVLESLFDGTGFPGRVWFFSCIIIEIIVYVAEGSERIETRSKLRALGRETGRRKRRSGEKKRRKKRLPVNNNSTQLMRGEKFPRGTVSGAAGRF
jgi:hypothetical protein